MAILSSFGRETSLVNIIGPRSIFSILFTPVINLLLYLLFSCYHYHYYPVRFILVNNKAGGIDNSSVLVGKQSYLLCVQVQVKLATLVVNGAIVYFTTGR